MEFHDYTQYNRKGPVKFKVNANQRHKQRIYPITDECFMRFDHEANAVDTFNKLQDPHHNHTTSTMRSTTRRWPQ